MISDARKIENNSVPQFWVVVVIVIIILIYKAGFYLHIPSQRLVSRHLVGSPFLRPLVGSS